MASWSHSDLSQIANAPACGRGRADFHRPVGCAGPDGASAVFYTGRDDGHIHELRLRGGTWAHSDLWKRAGIADSAPKADASPMACVTPDQRISIAYVVEGKHVHALQIQETSVSHLDVSALAGGFADPIGPPPHFVRGDGVLAIYYANSSGSNRGLHQLALSGGRWVDSNITPQSQPPFSAIFKTAGFVRPGATASIIHPQDGLQEYALGLDGTWKKTNLLDGVSAPAPNPLRWPTAFIRADGVPSIVYADFTEHLHELAFTGGRWRATALTASASAPRLNGLAGPTAYVRADGVSAVVYCGENKRIQELSLVDGRWRHADLSGDANTDTFGFPFAYVRGDGVSSVVYVSGQDRHIHELSLASV